MDIEANGQNNEYHNLEITLRIKYYILFYSIKNKQMKNIRTYSSYIIV